MLTAYAGNDNYVTNSYFVCQNRNGFPLFVSGVPPDAFSETGQLWGRFVLNQIFHIEICGVDET